MTVEFATGEVDAESTVDVRLLDLTLGSAVENLALDEALLEELDENGGDPVLRFWESDRDFIVLGFASSLASDVNIDACEQDSVPVLRRATGGGTVLQGPGCLSYAFVLPMTLDRRLTNIGSTYTFMLQRIAQALRRWEPATAFRGISDLAIEGMKISGNAQRRKRHAILFHGTILYGMRADRIARYVKQPKRQPEYRADRPHDQFLRTIHVPPHQIKAAIAEAWQARLPLNSWPRNRMPDAIANVTQRSSEGRS